MTAFIPSAKPTVCLNMIVRNEAKVIERCLASVRPLIDSWVIVDTGSDDDTANRIQTVLQGLPGQLHHRPWKNFGFNRTEALSLATQYVTEKADYLLFIDADETLKISHGFQWPSLVEPAYSIEASIGSHSYDRVSLVSTAYAWRWVGVLHEYLDCGQVVSQPRLKGVAINVTAEGARSADQLKYQKDAETLSAALVAEPNNSRYMFYLAQSQRDSGQLISALHSYTKRAAMGGWDEEVFYSLYECGLLAARLDMGTEHVLAAHLKAHQYRPQRAEPLVVLATYFRHRREWHNAYLFARGACELNVPSDRLFVDLSAYQWRAQDELALASFYSGRQGSALHLWTAMLTNGHLPETERPRIEANIGYIQKK
jgi:glycosyltransferase involved in cell wall biosynthesis